LITNPQFKRRITYGQITKKAFPVVVSLGGKRQFKQPLQLFRSCQSFHKPEIVKRTVLFKVAIYNTTVRIMKIKATFVVRKFQDSGSDGAPDYYVYCFTQIIDERGKKLSDKWIKETKLMQAVNFVKGREYNITLSTPPYSGNSINLPYPIEVSWGEEKIYIKNGNSIIKVDGKGNERNLSEPVFKASGTDNFLKGFFNKFHKGTLTVEELKRMNSRGVFYQIKVIDPQDKRKSGEYGYSSNSVKNFIHIAQETEEQIQRALRILMSSDLRKELFEHFEVSTEILPPKRRKPKNK